jgi:peptidoglycan/xylan/chitin deacetylase (PgdA/CDA1 family)
MPLRKLARHARDAWEVPRDLALGRYPEFVTGGPLPRGDVPVFVFHSLERESFERKLRYLSENGYLTLSAEQYFNALMGASPVPDRAVVLTFDDGRGSIWTVGLPLMRRFGMRGIVFLVPGRTPSRPGPLPPTWDDVEAGRAQAAAVRERESAEGALLSWEEIEALARTGIFDFESHTLTHSRVHTGPHLAGFATPASRKGYEAFDMPLIGDEGGDRLGEDVPLGTPLFRSAPRTSEALRFHEDPEVRRASVEAVAQGGGEGFFLRKDWEPELRRRMAGHKRPGRLESPEERTAAIRTELVEAKRRIEERTGREVVHLCYPWHTAGPTARRLAHEIGYRMAFCGKVSGVPLTRPGGDLHSIARIGEDYLELLPGHDRSTLSAILYRKWSRRIGVKGGLL